MPMGLNTPSANIHLSDLEINGFDTNIENFRLFIPSTRRGARDVLPPHYASGVLLFIARD